MLRFGFDPFFEDVAAALPALFDGPRSCNSCSKPPVPGHMRSDIRKTDDGLAIDINLPGYQKEDISISLNEGVLCVSAKREENNDKKDEDGNFIRRERYCGSCRREYYVGDNVSEDDVKAAFNNGVLTISVPELPEVKPETKQIAID